MTDEEKRIAEIRKDIEEGCHERSDAVFLLSVIDRMKREREELLDAMEAFGSYAREAKRVNTKEYFSDPDGYTDRMKAFIAVWDRIKHPQPQGAKP